MAGIFRFKQFSIDQSGCAMKINTDGVLLGALAKAELPLNVLDIGTGTGVIALMLAQRFDNAVIDAVEIDKAASETAKLNFANSPFASRLTLHPESIKSFFEANANREYDLIISNPPFYINSLASPGAGKKLAKHTDASFFEEMIGEIPSKLTDTGALWLILPIATADLVKKLAANSALYLQHIILVKSYPESGPHREIIKLGLHETNATRSEFVIYDVPNQYSGQYQTALQDFFTIFP